MAIDGINNGSNPAGASAPGTEWADEMVAIDGKGFLSTLSDMFNQNVVRKKGALDEALKKVTEDASSPESLAKYQAALAEYTLYRNAQSNVVKAYKDVDANTIRNFN